MKKNNLFAFSQFTSNSKVDGMIKFNWCLQDVCNEIGVNYYELICKNVADVKTLKSFALPDYAFLLDQKPWRVHFGHSLSYLNSGDFVYDEKRKISKDFWNLWGWNDNIQKILRNFQGDHNVLFINLYYDFLMLSPKTLALFDKIYLIYHNDLKVNFLNFDKNSSLYGYTKFIPKKLYSLFLEKLYYKNIAKKTLKYVDGFFNFGDKSTNYLISRRLKAVSKRQIPSSFKIINNFLPIFNKDIRYDKIYLDKKPSYNFFAAGRFESKQKNIKYLLEIFNFLPNHFHLDIYGSIEQKNLKIIEKNSNITFKGFINNQTLVNEIISKYDGYVNSSIHEGFCFAVLENILCGNTVFLLDTFVLAKYYTNVIGAGLLIDPNNSPKKVASLISTDYEQQFYKYRSAIQKFWTHFDGDYFIKTCKHYFLDH